MLKFHRTSGRRCASLQWTPHVAPPSLLPASHKVGHLGEQAGATRLPDRLGVLCADARNLFPPHVHFWAETGYCCLRSGHGGEVG